MSYLSCGEKRWQILKCWPSFHRKGSISSTESLLAITFSIAPRDQFQNLWGGITRVASNVKHGFDPACFNTVFPRQTQFREALVHYLEEPVSIAKKQGIVGCCHCSLTFLARFCHLNDDPNEEILVKLVCNLLPSVKDLCGALFQGLWNSENSDSFWNRNQLYLPREDDSKACSSASSNRPKMIFAHGCSVKNFAISIDNSSIKDIVSTKAILSHHGTICTSSYVSTNA
ncbi:hypothetical protein QQP08_018841 [Theobroma cacao]|nr:hypothetical protein QQP08_018841 [Theobroma cacao]